MRIESHVKVDFQQPGVRPTVYAAEGDTGSRFVVIDMYNGGQPYSVGAGVTGVVRYAKTDGSSGVYDTIDEGKSTERAACIFHDNSRQVVVELAPNICRGFGLVALAIQFVAGNSILRTFAVNVLVERDPTDGTRAEDYFSFRALSELYEQVDSAEENAATALSAANAALAATTKDITAEYNAAVATRPTLTPDDFFLEQEAGLYSISLRDDVAYFTACVTTPKDADVVEFSYDQTRYERHYIYGKLISTLTEEYDDEPASLSPAQIAGFETRIAALEAAIANLTN